MTKNSNNYLNFDTPGIQLSTQYAVPACIEYLNKIWGFNIIEAKNREVVKFKVMMMWDGLFVNVSL